MSRLATGAAFGLLAITALKSPAEEQERSRPPRKVTCPRDKLTSFTGKAVSYSRGAEQLTLTVATDWETTEKFTLHYPRGTDPSSWFLLTGESFQPENWGAIEVSKGRLRSGVRVTVWVCEGEANPTLDWQPPPEK